MKILPKDIQERFYRTIIGDLSLEDFEQWLYVDKELEKYLSGDDYLELISLSFKKSGAKYELSNLLKKYIDIGEFETFKLLGFLYEAKQKTNRLPSLLKEFYMLYSNGYRFLEDLGLGIGLAIEVPRVNNSDADTWDELTSEQQKELLDCFSPQLEECIDLVIDWLESKKIILTGSQDAFGDHEYIDNRSEEKKISKLWVVVSENKETGFSKSENILWGKKTNKKWWEFWK